MAVRRRILPSGATRWLADYRDDTGKRRFRQFSTKHEATCFHGAATARGSAFEPNPTYYRPLRFTAKVPANGWRNDAGRESVVAAFCAEHPHYQPSAGSIVLHIDAVMSPASTMADVDNLLKPVLDALKGNLSILPIIMDLGSRSATPTIRYIVRGAQSCGRRTQKGNAIFV